jgi:CHAD domain-containing protein
MKPEDKLLDLDAQPALRLRALQQLVRAGKVAARLRDADPEALHDFRVALRQLRTTLSVLQEHFEGSISRKHKRRLAKLGRRTGAARDAQVGLGILSDVGADLTEYGGVARLFALLSGEAAQSIDDELITRFHKVARRLHRKLERYSVRLDPDQPMIVRSFESAVRQSARGRAQTLGARLLEITGEADSVAIHRARIAGKRLRYVLALLGTRPTIADATSQLRGLQELLGTLTDIDRLRQRVACLRSEADDESLNQLEGRLRDLHARAYGELHCGWLGGTNTSFFERVLKQL